MFELDGHTGWIKVVSSLDRDAEDVKKTGGVYTMVVRVSCFSITLKYIVGRESKACMIDFYIFQERQKTELLLLGVSYIAESQTGLYLETFKFTFIGFLNFQ